MDLTTTNSSRYVVGFAFDIQKKLVALIEKTHPAEQRGKMNGVGGRIEPGESPVGAMVREFLEETGVATTREDWHQFHYERHKPRPNGRSTCLYFYAMSTNFDVYPPKTMTDEKVWQVSYTGREVKLNILSASVMYNLVWLLPMGLCYLMNPEHQYLEG